MEKWPLSICQPAYHPFYRYRPETNKTHTYAQMCLHSYFLLNIPKAGIISIITKTTVPSLLKPLFTSEWLFNLWYFYHQWCQWKTTNVHVSDTVLECLRICVYRAKCKFPRLVLFLVSIVYYYSLSIIGKVYHMTKHPKRQSCFIINYTHSFNGDVEQWFRRTDFF